MPGRTPDKLRTGQPFSVRQTTWNDLIESKEDHANLRRLGVPKELRHFPISTDKIKVRNESGDDRRLGEVVEIGNEIIIDIVDPEHLWQTGIATTTTRPFGILRHAVKLNEIEELQVSGVCKALVNVIDVEHQYAKVVCGEFVLESAVTGSVRILYQPGEIGEEECIVLLTGIEPASIMEGELAEDLCPADAEATVINCILVPDCTSFEPAKVTNPRRHAGESGAKFVAYRKQCKPTDAEDCQTAGDEEWVIFDIELRDVCYVIGIEDRDGCLVAAALRTGGEWCPDNEPTTACVIVDYNLCSGTTPDCDEDWSFDPLFACCVE